MTRPAPNEHGVYSATESLILPRNQKGWRGPHVAEIDLCDLGDRWLWATGFQIMGGDFHGRSSPLTEHRSAASRAGALALAMADLRHAMTGKESKDAASILEWLSGLDPAQMSLF